MTISPSELHAQAEQARRAAARAKEDAERSRRQVADIKKAAAAAKSEQEFNAAVRRIRSGK